MAEDTRSGEAPPLVSGADIHTFLFADMRGYTRYTQEHGDDAAAALAGRFADLVNQTVPAFEGELLGLAGDEALCVFRSARQALRAAVELQRRLRTATDSESAFPIGVGMGLDAGEAVPTHDGYRGAALNLAARLCAIAKPGEILATDGVAHLAQRVEGLRFTARRPVRAKGVAAPARFVQVNPVEPLPALPPPPPRRGRKVPLLVAVVSVGALALVAALISRSGAGHKHPAAVAPLVSVGAFRVDPKTNRISSVLPLRQTTTISGIGVGFGSIWLATARGLERLNPQSGQVIHTTPLTGGGGPLALGFGRVFTTGAQIGTNSVQVIDPSHPNNFPTVFPMQPFKANRSQGSFFVATGYGSLWVWESGATGCCGGRVFWRVDPRTGHVERRWLNPESENGAYFVGPNAVAVGREGVWRVRNGELQRIDPRTWYLSAPVPNLDATAVADGDGAVWALGPVGLVAEVSPSVSTVAWKHRFSGATINRFVAGYGSVWLEDTLGRRIIRIDAATHRISSIPVPYPLGPMALTAHALWVAFPSSGEAPA